MRSLAADRRCLREILRCRHLEATDGPAGSTIKPRRRTGIGGDAKLEPAGRRPKTGGTPEDSREFGYPPYEKLVKFALAFDRPPRYPRHRIFGSSGSRGTTHAAQHTARLRLGGRDSGPNSGVGPVRFGSSCGSVRRRFAPHGPGADSNPRRPESAVRVPTGWRFDVARTVIPDRRTPRSAPAAADVDPYATARAAPVGRQG